MNFRSPAVPDLDRPAIEALIAKADAGEPRAWAYLCAWALNHDAVLHAAAKARAHAAVAAFRPPGPRLHMEIVDEVDRLPSSVLLVALYAPAIGYALFEMQYRRAWFRVEGVAREQHVVGRLCMVDPSHVRFARDTDEPMLASASGATQLPMDKFLMVLGTGDGIAVKRGYMRRAIFPVIERRQLLAKVIARGALPMETDDERKKIGELDAEIVGIAMEGREHDAGLLGSAVQQLVRAVLRVNAEALVGVDVSA